MKEGSKAPLPPKFAICNNWAVMALPQHILDMKPTWAEFSCTALAQIAVKYDITGKTKTSEKKRLRSHGLIFVNAQPAAQMFPRSLGKDEYFVVFANMETGEITIEKRTRLLVRCKVTNAISAHYRCSLVQYQNVPTNNEAFFGPGVDEIILDNFEDDGKESTIIAEAALPFQRPGFVPTGSTIIGFLGKSTSPELDPKVMAAAAAGAAGAAAGGQAREVLVVKRSSDCMDHRSREAELAAFPDLHSNGLGTVYDEDRRVKVSAKAGRQHLSMLSNRMFAQHPLWLIVNFDHMNKDNGQGYLSARLQRDPSLATTGYKVTQAELTELLQYQHGVRRAAQTGGAPPVLPANLQNAQRVISNIRAVESTLHGSEEERESFRRIMYAYVFQIGEPHFMLTVTPNDAANGMVATISKGGGKSDDPIAHFELNDDETKAKRQLIQELASKDPVACAIYFDEILTHILVNILGIDHKAHTAQPGLFGKVGWIGGGIENQGSQLLHAHLCIYIDEWPAWLVSKTNGSGNPEDSPMSTFSSLPEVVVEPDEDLPNVDAEDSNSEHSTSTVESESTFNRTSGSESDANPWDVGNSSSASSDDENEYADVHSLSDSESSAHSGDGGGELKPSIQNAAHKFTKEEIISLTEYVTTVDYPLLNLFYQPTENNPIAILCPCCGQGTLKAEQLTIFHKTDQVKNAPYVASCEACKKEFTSSALHEQCVNVVTGIVNDMASTDTEGFKPDHEAELYILSGATSFPIPDVASPLLPPARSIVQGVCVQRCGFADLETKEGTVIMADIAMINYLKDVTRLSVALFGVSEHKYNFCTSYVLCLFLFLLHPPFPHPLLRCPCQRNAHAFVFQKRQSGRDESCRMSI